jgi:hypothetical protein
MNIELICKTLTLWLYAIFEDLTAVFAEDLSLLVC